MLDNINYSEEWLLQEKIKTHFENKDGYIKIKKSVLLQLFIDFIKLNKRGE